jgi:hypothetical protein
MAQSEDDKAAEVLKKRRLAAKGLKERRDGKPVDPIEDAAEPDGDPERPESAEEKRERIAGAAIAGSALLRR